MKSVYETLLSLIPNFREKGLELNYSSFAATQDRKLYNSFHLIINLFRTK